MRHLRHVGHEADHGSLHPRIRHPLAGALSVHLDAINAESLRACTPIAELEYKCNGSVLDTDVFEVDTTKDLAIGGENHDRQSISTIARL